MKLKVPTAFLGISTLVLSITAWYFNVQLKHHQKTIANREWAIANYKKVINAIGRSSEISSDQLKKALSIDFNTGENGYNDFSNEYYYVLHPKSKEVNQNEIWDFMGLQLVFDHQQKLKTVDLYKP